jgi:hypothetical protein
MEITRFSFGYTRTWLISLFLIKNMCLPMTAYIMDINQYYAWSYFPTYLFGVPAILSVLLLVAMVYKTAVRLNKPTYVVLFYTLLAPFTLINIIPVMGLVTDITKLNKAPE